MTSFTFLIAGCGSAGHHVAQVAARDGRGQIAALVDPQPHQLDKQRELYPNAASGDDSVALLGETRPDVAIIVGPDHLHAEQTLLALEYGCHALVEKPLTTTVADARRVVEATAACNRRVMTDHTMRYAPMGHDGLGDAGEANWGSLLYPRRLCPRPVELLLKVRTYPYRLAHQPLASLEHPPRRRRPPHRSDSMDHR